VRQSLYERMIALRGTGMVQLQRTLDKESTPDNASRSEDEILNSRRSLFTIMKRKSFHCRDVFSK